MNDYPVKIPTPSGIFLIRPYVPGDEKQILELFKTVFGQELSRDEWEWKYRQNPRGFQIMLCFSPSGKLAAHYAGIPLKVICRGEERQITQLVDSMSNPAFRGTLSGRRGLFVKTVLAFFDMFGNERQSIFLYGFPGERHYKLGNLLLKYQRIGKEKFVLRKKTSPASMMHKLSGIRIKSTELPVPESFNSLWKQTKRSIPFAVYRDSTFLNWRYSRPGRNYKIWTFHSILSKSIKGLIVTARSKKGTVQLLDLLLPQGRTGKIMLKILESTMHHQGCAELEAWVMTHDPLYTTLQECGFSCTDEPGGIIPTGRTFWSGLDFNWAASNIRLYMSDCDLF